MVVIKLVWCFVDGSKTRSGQNGQYIDGDDIWVDAELFLREIKEHGYPFQCKVGNPLFSASSTAIEEQGLLKGPSP
jgi:hypothetical protein